MADDQKDDNFDFKELQNRFKAQQSGKSDVIKPSTTGTTKPKPAIKPPLCIKPGIGQKPLSPKGPCFPEIKSGVLSNIKNDLKVAKMPSSNADSSHRIAPSPNSLKKLKPVLPIEKKSPFFHKETGPPKFALGKVDCDAENDDFPPPPPELSLMASGGNDVDDLPLPSPPSDEKPKSWNRMKFTERIQNMEQQKENFAQKRAAIEGKFHHMNSEQKTVNGSSVDRKNSQQDSSAVSNNSVEEDELIITVDKIIYKVIRLGDEGPCPSVPKRPSWVKLHIANPRNVSEPTIEDDIYDDAETMDIAMNAVTASHHQTPAAVAEEEDIYDDAESNLTFSLTHNPCENVEETYDDAETLGVTTGNFNKSQPAAKSTSDIGTFDEVYDDIDTPAVAGLGSSGPPLPSRTQDNEKEKRQQEKKEREEQEKKIKEEKKKKEKEEKKLLEDRKKQQKEERKRKKRLKVKGDETILNVACILEDDNGGKLDLPVAAGEKIYIIRLDNNPAGKFLVQNEKGQYGYVSNENVDINEEDLKRSSLPSPYSNTNFHPGVGFKGSSQSSSNSAGDEYDDVEVIASNMADIIPDEDIYEEF
ncbi:uncharacterized protein LOC141898219 isoform X2 [Tubulanus polymorphus]|uniref:uncharacterized protein LOC141898219 isoform X2 n=1 Tax=Tubulanus polymorphus TaxID=672921 RepID=UPI003DA3F620